MKIKRTFKDTSLRAGQEEIIDLEKFKVIEGQTDVYLHRFGYTLISQSGVPRYAATAVGELIKGQAVETFFSRFELLEA